MRAVGYVRVSTEEQAREGYGLAAQERAVRLYCQAQEWELVGVYTDGGRSGKALRGREELARLLTDAEAGHFQRLVFTKLDRLARNLRDLLELCERLEAAGVGIVSIGEAIDTGTASGRMVRSVLGALGEFERETICERTRDGVAEALRQGKSVGRAPVGYRRRDGKLVPAPDMAPKVLEAFRQYATGQHSLRQLMPWAVRNLGIGNSTSLAALLRNPVYLGHVTHRSEVVAENVHEPIIESVLFETVQGQLARRSLLPPARPFGNERYPLTGIAVCNWCDAPMVGTRGGQRRRYIRCQTSQRMGKGACTQPMVKAEIVEGQISDYVGAMVLPDEYLDAVAEELRYRQAQVDDGEAERLTREIERWRRLFVLAEIDEDRLKAEVAPIKRRLAEIERPQSFDIAEGVSYLRDLARLWSGSPPRLQREFVQEVFARVVIKGPQVEAIAPKPLYAPLFVLDRQERFGGVVEMIKPPFGHHARKLA